jgi:predicted Zn-dependent peptidase
MLPAAKLTTLKNGTRVVIAPSQSELTTIVVAVRAGARCETPRTRGLAHLVEHQVFKGGKLYPTAEEVNAAIAAIGATYNASTNMEFTYYVIECAKERASEAYRILSDLYLRPRFDPAEFGKEKMVVLSELLRSHVDQGYYLSILFEDMLYGHQPLGWDINGTIRTLRKLRRADVLAYARAWHVGRGTCVLFLGGGDLRALARQAARDFSALPRGKAARWRPYVRREPTRRVRHLGRNDDMTAIMVGWAGRRQGAKDVPAQNALAEALAGVTSSRLYNRLREREGLVYEIYGGSEYYSDAGHMYVTTEARPRDADRVAAVILEELDRAIDVPFSEDEVATAKAQMLNVVARAPEDRESLAHVYFKSLFFEGKLRQLAAVRQEIQALTAADVNRVARALLRGGRFVASIGRRPLKVSKAPWYTGGDKS